MIKKQNIRDAVLMLAAVLLFSVLLPISGPWAQRSYAGNTHTPLVVKQGAVIIPVDFGNSSLDGGAAFTGGTFGPQVQITKEISNGAIEIIRYSLNDLYNEEGLREEQTVNYVTDLAARVTYAMLYPCMSINTYLKYASYGQNVVSPIYLSNTRRTDPFRPFVPFTVGTPETLQKIKADSGGGSDLDVAMMKPYLQKALQEASRANAFKKESVKTLPVTPGQYNLSTAFGEGAAIDHVVFLVNMGDGVEANPQNYRAYAISGPGGKEALGTLQMDMGADKDKESGSLQVVCYTVIPISEDMPEIMLHETMHIKGVEDLYKEVEDFTAPEGRITYFPCGCWDVQGDYRAISGPYYTQRQEMLINDSKQMRKAAVENKVEAVRRPGEKVWKTGSIPLLLNDINSLDKRAIAQHIEVSTENNQRLEFYMEYRRPETDLIARINKTISAEGFLLLYATEDDPFSVPYLGVQEHRYVRLLHVFHVSELLQNSASGKQYPIDLFVDDNGDANAAKLTKQEGKYIMEVLPHDDNPEDDFLPYRFGYAETGTLAHIYVEGCKKEGASSVTYHMSIELEPVTKENFK